MKKIIFAVICSLFCSYNLFPQANEQKFQLATSYEKSGDWESAVRLYEELYKDSPQGKYFDGIARIYKQQNRFAELRPFIDEQLKKDKSTDLLILSGEVNWKLGKTDAANADWEKAKSNYGNFAATYVKLAETLNTLMLFDKSIQVLKEAKSKYPDELVFSDGLARLYIITKNYTDGIEEVLYLLGKNNNVQQAQGKLYALMNDPQANAHIDEVFQKEFKKTQNTYVLILYSWYLRTNKKFAQALDVVIELDKVSNAKGYEIYRFGEESRRDGDYDVALKAFQTVLSMDKKATIHTNSALFSYTKTMEEKLQTGAELSQTDAEKIIKSYRKIIADYPKTQYSEQSRIRIAELESRVLNNQKAAIKELEDVIETKFSALYVVQAISGLYNIYLQNNDIEKSKHYISQLLKTYGKMQASPDIMNLVNKAKFIQGEIFYFQGAMDSASVIFQELSKSTNTDIANDAIDKVVLIEQNKNFVKALNTFAKAELAVKQNRTGDAIALFNEVANIGSGEQIGEKSIIKAAELEIDIDSLSLAASNLKKYLNDNIYPLYGDNALFLLGSIAEKQGSKTDAVSYYTSLLTKYPRSILLVAARKRIQELRTIN